MWGMPYNGKCMLRTGCGVVFLPCFAGNIAREPGTWELLSQVWNMHIVMFTFFFFFSILKTVVVKTSPLLQTATLKYRVLTLYGYKDSPLYCRDF